ncbi:MAG: hypothetical protein IIA99_02825 [Proteobacteria bacterium]|nr:hypothetical protein [Pseudomonadota bacterium]
MNSTSIIETFLKNANQLKFKNIFFLVVGLFIIDLLVPDFIPYIDEIILGLLAIILANWKKERKQDDEGTLIEGEIIDENKESR